MFLTNENNHSFKIFVPEKNLPKEYVPRHLFQCTFFPETFVAKSKCLEGNLVLCAMAFGRVRFFQTEP